MFEWISQLDEWLIALIMEWGLWAYLLLFIIVFCESGVVPMIFLPGDGFIFSLGVIAYRGAVFFWPTLLLLILATLLGYQFNFWTGQKYGVRLLQPGRWKWVKSAYLQRTQDFFHQYGRQAIFFGRFIPIIRTIAPFVAGIGKMYAPYFVAMNLIGGGIWMTLFFTAGYYLGHIKFVQQQFIWIYLGMFLLSTVPASIGVWWTARKKAISTSI